MFARRNVFPSVTAGIAASLAAMSVHAADTATVTVSATVPATCQFTTNTGTVSFTLDPTSNANATGTVSAPVFWCTNGTPYTITDDLGLNEGAGTVRKMKISSGTDTIPYSFSYTASGTGTGKSGSTTLSITSAVVNSDYVNAKAGTYSDTVTITLSF